MPTTIEDFESVSVGGLPSGYVGDTGSFEVSDTQAYDGTNSITHTNTDFGYSVVKDETVVFQQGDTIETRVYFTTTANYAQSLFAFGVQDTVDDSIQGYFARSIPYNNSVELKLRDSGTDSATGEQLAEATVSFPTDEWCRVFVDWGSSGDITATFENASGSQLGQVSATDTTFSSGGYGWMGYNQPWYADTVIRNPTVQSDPPDAPTNLNATLQ